MRRRWRYILPLIGLLLFAGQTYNDFKHQDIDSTSQKYFWWGSLPLDKHPGHVYPNLNFGWGDPATMKLIPGYTERILKLTGLPAFVASDGIVKALAEIKVSELITFLVTAPLLLAAWYYFLGWLIDRRQNRKAKS